MEKTEYKFISCGLIGKGGQGEITRLFHKEKKEFYVLKLFMSPSSS
jgi:hypothetical protein